MAKRKPTNRKKVNRKSKTVKSADEGFAAEDDALPAEKPQHLTLLDESGWLNKIQHKSKRAFLSAYAMCYRVVKAAKATQIHYTNHYFWLREDPVYVEAFQVAESMKLGFLESEAIRRAVQGDRRLKFDRHGQALIDPYTNKPYREYQRSDALLSQQLKAADKVKYADRNEQTGPNGGPIQQEIAAIVLDLEAKSDGELERMIDVD